MRAFTVAETGTFTFSSPTVSAISPLNSPAFEVSNTNSKVTQVMLLPFPNSWTRVLVFSTFTNFGASTLSFGFGSSAGA